MKGVILGMVIVFFAFVSAGNIKTDEINIDVVDLINLFAGEFSLAVAPSKDGAFGEIGDVDIGMTFMASILDQDEILDMAEELLDILAYDFLGVEYDTDGTTIGDFDFEEVIVDDFGDQISLLFYGANEDYFVIGSSEDMLDIGFDELGRVCAGNGRSKAQPRTLGQRCSAMERSASSPSRGRRNSSFWLVLMSMKIQAPKTASLSRSPGLTWTK